MLFSHCIDRGGTRTGVGGFRNVLDAARLSRSVCVALRYCVMRRPARWAPSIVPKGDDQNVYLVVDDLGRLGRVYRETDVEATDLDTVISDLLGGQYSNPVRVVAFN